MYIQRILSLPELLRKKSFFLFGPRATGKTSLIQEQLKEQAIIINLLRGNQYLKLKSEPWLLEEFITAEPEKKIVVIDEIQRVPELLNEVHHFIEAKKLTFLLTGSSARKLRHGQVNLLAGRAWESALFPLTSQEIKDFNLERYLQYGGLPAVYLSDSPEEELEAYASTYLEQEIQAEAMVRRLDAFARFLKVAALTSGQMLNFSSLASDVGLSATTVRGYYQILEDTLLGSLLPAWSVSKKRKALATGKFYFFDTGLKHQLAEIEAIPKKSDLFGSAFEHFILMELKAYISYRRIRKKISYWQTKHGIEVDFLIGDEVAIEVKASTNVQNKHLKGLKILKEEGVFKKYYIVSQDSLHRMHEGIEIIHWKEFLDKLWLDEVV